MYSSFDNAKIRDMSHTKHTVTRQRDKCEGRLSIYIKLTMIVKVF